MTRLTGGDRHWAEDAVQETLLRAWRQRDRWRGRHRLADAVAGHHRAPEGTTCTDRRQSCLLYGERFAAADTATGVTGVLGVEPRGFGTHVALELRGVHGPLRCSLTVVSKTGERETAATWGVPEHGYGVPESPNPLIIHGATSIAPDDIARFEITTTERTLLSVPATA